MFPVATISHTTERYIISGGGGEVKTMLVEENVRIFVWNYLHLCEIIFSDKSLCVLYY